MGVGDGAGAGAGLGDGVGVGVGVTGAGVEEIGTGDGAATGGGATLPPELTPPPAPPHAERPTSAIMLVDASKSLFILFAPHPCSDEHRDKMLRLPA